jgi:hypothetical protein
MTTIYKKLIIAKSKFPDIVKNVSGYGYKYANLSQVIEAISEPLWAEGLDFYQTIKDGKMQTGIIDCDTGDKIELVEFEVVSATIAKSTEIQALGGGITYLRRYSLMLAFGLGVEDDDGATGKNPVTQKKSQQSTPTITKTQLQELYAIKKPSCSTELIAKIEAVLTGNDAAKIAQAFEYLKGL